MAETPWTPDELRRIPRWWARAHLKDRDSLELAGQDDVRRLLVAYEAEHARAKRLEAENARLRQTLADIAAGSHCGTEGCDTDNPECDVMSARAALAGDAPVRGEEG